MDRRQYLALASTGLAGLLAGCSFGQDETPTETPNSTETPTETVTNTTETTTEEGPPSGIEQPQTMGDIAQFTFNHHQKNLQTLPYVMKVSSEDTSNEQRGSQNYTYKFDGDNRAVFALEYSTPDGLATVEKFSTGGLVYTRSNPPNGEISYESDTVDDGTVFRLTGLNQIDQLDKSGVEVGEPEEQMRFVYRYPITAHDAYDTVSGYIELDIQQGVITAVEFEGGSTYSLSMNFRYGGVDFKTPSWVKDMEN